MISTSYLISRALDKPRQTFKREIIHFGDILEVRREIVHARTRVLKPMHAWTVETDIGIWTKDD